MSANAIPGYTLKKKLGAGAMASVFLARDEKLHRDVALKVMSKKLLADPSFVDRFLREARIVASVSHRNIVAVYDVGSHNNFHYMAMEFLSGGDLSAKLKQGISLKHRIACIIDIAEGLHYAASKKLIHRDIKPDNIMFGEDGRAVITDFGIARDASSETNMTIAGAVIGTPQYMSPEQAAAKALDHRTDLYSLGIILYQMLAGKTPFKGDSAISTAVMHINNPVPPLPQKHDRFQFVVDKALAKNPDDRFQSGKEFIEALAHISLEINGSEAEENTDATVSFDTADTATASAKPDAKETSDFLIDLSDEFLASDAPIAQADAEPATQAKRRTHPTSNATTQSLSLTMIEEGLRNKHLEEAPPKKNPFSALPMPRKSVVILLLVLFSLLGGHIVVTNVLGKKIPFQAMATSLGNFSEKNSETQISFSRVTSVLESLSNGLTRLAAPVFGNAQYPGISQNERLYLELINKAIAQGRYYEPPMDNAAFYLQELARMQANSIIVKDKANELMRSSIANLSKQINAGQFDAARKTAADAKTIVLLVESENLRNRYQGLVDNLQ